MGFNSGFKGLNILAGFLDWVWIWNFRSFSNKYFG